MVQVPDLDLEFLPTQDPDCVKLFVNVTTLSPADFTPDNSQNTEEQQVLFNDFNIHENSLALLVPQLLSSLGFPSAPENCIVFVLGQTKITSLDWSLVNQPINRLVQQHKDLQDSIFFD